MTTVYLAGANASTLAAVAGKHVLISYHGAASSQRAMLAARAEGTVAGLILDCGAFTAWSKGTPVDLAGYIAFVKQAIALGQLDAAIALDVIPGAPGRLPTAAEVASAKAETLANLTAMTAAGIPAAKLMPVATLHDASWSATIAGYLAAGFTTIALGGCAKSAKSLVKPWLDAVFAAFPGVKFHLLGMTRAWTSAYPAESCDSTSWLMLAKNRHAEGGAGFGDNSYVAKGLSAWGYFKHQATALVATGGGHDLSDAELRAVGAYGLTTRALGGAGAFLPTEPTALAMALAEIRATWGSGVSLERVAGFLKGESGRGAIVLPAFTLTDADRVAAGNLNRVPAVAVFETPKGQLGWAFAA